MKVGSTYDEVYFFSKVWKNFMEGEYVEKDGGWSFFYTSLLEIIYEIIRVI